MRPEQSNIIKRYLTTKNKQRQDDDDGGDINDGDDDVGHEEIRSIIRLIFHLMAALSAIRTAKRSIALRFCYVRDDNAANLPLFTRIFISFFHSFFCLINYKWINRCMFFLFPPLSLLWHFVIMHFFFNFIDLLVLLYSFCNDIVRI